MAPKSKSDTFKSTVGINYPSLQKEPALTCQNWLCGKRTDDGAEGLWRIHNGIYDFTEFINVHPGGQDWLILTKGTDITEAFEVHHIKSTPETMLEKYRIRSTTVPRNSPFSFRKDGFYRTLKKNIRPKLETLPKSSIKLTNLYTDLLMISTFLFSILTVKFNSYILGIVASYCFSCLAIAAHNYYHKKDNYRMLYFDLTPMRSRDWRIVHILSHHLYTNTQIDLEISMFEPWLQWLPKEKPLFHRYGSWIYSPVSYMSMFYIVFAQRMYGIIFDRKGVNKFLPQDLLQCCIPLAMYIFNNAGAQNVLFWWWFIFTTTSFIYGLVGINAAHHHPEVFHDGDKPRPAERDWGIMQLDSVMDRRDITGSHFLVLTNFGDHALHHLFPTLDHGLYQYLYPEVIKTCEQFGLELRMRTQLEMVIGQFKQLTLVKPNESSPGSKRKR